MCRHVSSRVIMCCYVSWCVILCHLHVIMVIPSWFILMSISIAQQIQQLTDGSKLMLSEPSSEVVISTFALPSVDKRLAAWLRRLKARWQGNSSPVAPVASPFTGSVSEVSLGKKRPWRNEPLTNSVWHDLRFTIVVGVPMSHLVDMVFRHKVTLTASPCARASASRSVYNPRQLEIERERYIDSIGWDVTRLDR